MCPYENPKARRLWGKACNYHRGKDLKWNCGNPAACQRTLDAAKDVENRGWK